MGLTLNSLLNRIVRFFIHTQILKVINAWSLLLFERNSVRWEERMIGHEGDDAADDDHVE